MTHPDIIRYFMLIPEAAQLVIQAGAMGQGGEIFVLDMGEPVRILDLAHDMIRLSGLRVGEDIEVEIVGLRPGEKLYEELYDKSELHQRTDHPKIMVAESAKRNAGGDPRHPPSGRRWPTSRTKSSRRPLARSFPWASLRPQSARCRLSDGLGGMLSTAADVGMVTPNGHAHAKHRDLA